MGLSEATAKSPRMISTAKSAPAIGPLKVAAIPAAAPQPTRVRSWRGGAFNKRPSQDAAAAPIWTIGPSRPTEPPDPIVIADTSVFRPSTRRRIVPPCRATASMTSGTPGPRASRPKSVISVPTMRPPSAGISARCQRASSRAGPTGSVGSANSPASTTSATPSAPPKNAPWKNRIRMRKTTAPAAPANPSATAHPTIPR
jgi:hypothetical protein